MYCTYSSHQLRIYMSKGSLRRPLLISEKEANNNWDRIFKKKQSRIDTIGQNGNDGQHYEYELNKSTGEVEKKFDGS